MTHDEIAELLGAYVLDAISPEEREMVDAHLETCSVCQAEVAQLLGAHDLLASLAIERDPPPELRSRLLAMVEQDRAIWASEQHGTASAATPMMAAPAASAWQGRLGQRLRRVPRLAYGIGGALAAAAVILIVVLVTRNTVTTHTYSGGAAAPVVDGISFRGVTAQVAVRSDHTTTVRCVNLPTLPPALAYELWFIPAKGPPIPVDGFAVNGRQIWEKPYKRDTSGIQTVALTIERAPGMWPTPSKYLAVAVTLKG